MIKNNLKIKNKTFKKKKGTNNVKMNQEKDKILLMQEFRNQLVIFLDELIEQFPKEGDFVLIRIFIKDQLPVSDILGRYIRDLLPFKKLVDERQEKFFLENQILYTGGNLAQKKINHFKELWISDALDENDREIIWQWMDMFNTIASRYFEKYGYISGWERKQQISS